jgi:5'/3'-nucleotidase SurE
MSLDILLTNDDGYGAAGLTTLAAALTAAGHTVHIVAPETNQSAKGSTLGGVAALSQPVSFTEFSEGNFYVSGSPVVAARTALDYILPTELPGFHPDIVISGTNAGDNTGESANISGTINAALAALYEGIPAIAVSAGSSGGSYAASYANAAAMVVDLLDRLESERSLGGSLLPPGEALSINVPGQAIQNGVAATVLTSESAAYFPIGQTSTGQYASAFMPNTQPSGDPLSEGSNFLLGNATVTALDGNWSAGASTRLAVEQRLDGLATPPATARPLDIMLVNDDGYAAPGLAAVRDALVAAGHHVTVVAPSSQQSGVGTSLTLGAFDVTAVDATTYAVGATPTTTVYTGLDALLTGEDRPDLVVSGSNEGNNVGLFATASGTLSAAVAAVFNYDLPAIAISTATDATGGVPTGLYETSADFLVDLIAQLEATQGASQRLLPGHTGLNVNIPLHADLGDYAVTELDAASNLSVAIGQLAGQPEGTIGFNFGPGIATADPYSEGNAFNAGHITVTPIDGSYGSDDLDALRAVADAIGAAAPGVAAPGYAWLPGAAQDYAVAVGADGVTVRDLAAGTITTLANTREITFADASLDLLDPGISFHLRLDGARALSDILYTTANGATWHADQPDDPTGATLTHFTARDGDIAASELQFGRQTLGGCNGEPVLALDWTGRAALLEAPGDGPDQVRIDDFTGDSLTLRGFAKQIVQLDDDVGLSRSITLDQVHQGSVRLGAGDDLVKVDFADDANGTVSIRTGAGRDSVQAAADDAGRLHALLGDGDDLFQGGAGRDRADGGAGKDLLSGGGAERDVLTGGADADTFLFAAASAANDRITDFAPGEDMIAVSAAGFGGGLAAGVALTADQFLVAENRRSDAPAGQGQFVYDEAHGRLWWDADGARGADPLLIAVLAQETALAASDIHVIA